MRGNTYGRAIAVLLAAAAVGLSAGTAQAAVTIFSGTSGSDWNAVTNWSNGVPAGAIDAVIAAGVAAQVQNTATPTYTGNLTLQTNSTLQFSWNTPKTEYWNALGTPGSTIIYMYDGSLINMRNTGSPQMPAVQLMGNATISMGQSTQPSSSPIFGQGINGPYTLTLKGKGGCTATLNVASTFGELVADSQWGTGWSINATAAGSLGGDVTIKANPSTNVITANLTIGAANAMADTATLSLYGSASATKLTMNQSDAIAKLIVDGTQQEAGTYGKVGAVGVDYQVSWLSGTGILTVLGVPSLYWDLNDANAGAGGATPAGTWDAANTYWNSVAGGTAATAAWSAGKTAVFAAGTDANGSYTVTVDGTHQIGGLTFGEGNVTLSGGALQMTGDSLVRVASGQTATIATTISNDATARQLTKGGDGTLILSGANTHTGVTRIEGGTLSVSSLANAGSDSPIGNYATAGADGLVLAGGTLQYTGDTAATDRGFTLMGNATIDISTPGAALTLGNCASSDVNGTLTVTGASGSSLALGQVKIIEGASMTLNPTSVTMTVASALGYTSYSAYSYLTLGGTTAGNVITGDLTIENPPGSGYLQAMYVTKSGTGEWTILGAVNTGGNVTVNGGTLILTGTNTYTGTTTVNGGTLIVGTDAPSGAAGALGLATSDVNLGVASSTNSASLLIAGPYTIGRNIRNATTNTTDPNARVLTLGGSTADSSLFSGNIYLGTASQTAKGVTLTAASGGVVNFSGVIQNPTGMDSTEAAAAAAMNAVTKVGPGTVVLSGANTYTGATAVNEGTLVARNASALGAGSAANVSVASGAGMDYRAAADVPLAIGGTLTVTAGAGTAIGGSVGSTAVSAAINVAGDAVITDEAHTVNITGVSGVAHATGLVTLIHGNGAGSSLNPATPPTLGMVYNNTDFTVGSFAQSASDLQVNIIGATALTAAYWKGGLAGATNVWAVSDGSAASNWVTAAAGGATGVVPGPDANVVISADSITTAPTATVLGASMTVKTLTISDTTNGLGLKADGSTLTITPTDANTGITVDASVPASQIAADVALGAAQRWTNNSANPLTVSGAVSGSGTLTKAGDGVVILSGNNTFTGVTTVAAGTLKLGNANALGGITGSTSVTAGAVLDLNGTAVAAEPVTINGTGISGGGALVNSSGTAASLAGAVTIGADGTSIGGAGDITLSAALAANANSLVKVGGNKLTLKVNSTRTGAIRIDTGTLRIESASAFGDATTNVTINSGGTFEIGSSNNADVTIANGTGVVTLNDGGTISNGQAGKAARVDKTINVQNTGTPVVTFDSGVNAANVLTINGGGDSRLTGGATGAKLQIKGSGTVDVGDGTTTRINSVVGDWYLQGGKLQVRADTELGDAANKLYFQGGTLVTGTAFTSARTYDFSDASGGAIDTTGGSLTLATAGQLTGAYQLTKAGINSLIFSAANAGFTGKTAINAGAADFTKRVALYNDTAASWTPTNIAVESGAVLALGVGDHASGYFDNTDVDTVLDASHMGASTGSTGMKSGAILGLDTTNAGGTFTRATAIANLSGGNSIGLAKLGTGTLILSAANTYTGPTTVSAGTLTLSGAGTLGNGGALTMSGGQLNLGGLSRTVGAVIITAPAASGDTITNGSLTGTSYAASNASGTVTISANLLASGSAGFTKLGAGTATLTGTNTYTGVTTVGAGTLSVSSLANAGSASPIGQYPTAGAGGLVLAGGTFQYTGGSTSVNRGFTLIGSSTINVSTGGAALTLGTCSAGSTLAVTGGSGSSLSLGAVTLIGATTFNPTSAALTVPSVSGAYALTLDGTSTSSSISGVIGTSGGALTKSGNGTWKLLSGSSTYTGVTTISAGVLEASVLANGGSNSSIGKSTNVAANLVFGAPAATLRYTGSSNVTINRGFTLSSGAGGGATIESSGSGTLSIDNTIALAYGTASQTRLLTLGGTNTGANTFSKVIGNNTSATSLTKAGTGTWVLGGTNTYTGATTISGGTLLVNGNQSAASGAVAVNANGTLGGIGTIGGAVTVNASGTLAPGNRALTTPAAGTLKIANAVNLASGTTEMRLFSPTESDKLWQSTAGGLTYGGILKITDLDPVAFAVGNNWDLFDFDSRSGTFSNNAELDTVGGTYLPLLITGQKWNFDYATGVLSVVSSNLPGDTNGDRVVDAADYLAVKQNLGRTGGASLGQGNLDGDGDVDWDDLQLVMTNFGTGSGTAPTTTPEPATLGLLAIGALAVLRRNRRS
jgi:autotransporter-associated beta strand protein